MTLKQIDLHDYVQSIQPEVSDRMLTEPKDDEDRHGNECAAVIVVALAVAWVGLWVLL